MNCFLIGLDNYECLHLFNDITMQVNAENTLHDVASNLTAVVENTDDIIFSVDFNQRLMLFNKLSPMNVSVVISENQLPVMNIAHISHPPI